MLAYKNIALLRLSNLSHEVFMKAVVFKDVGSLAVEEVANPSIQHAGDAIIRITRSAICGTDLHAVRGTMPGMKSSNLFHRGVILGHEGVGVVEEIGSDVKHFTVGERVIVPSTIACGSCIYCKQELYAQCDKANPVGPDSGTAFYGGPISTGSFDGMQAEKVRVPFADTNLIRLPAHISDDQAILLSDILPTAYMGVGYTELTQEDSVAVFGCGPVGQIVIGCLKALGIKHIFAIDRIPFRLDFAQKQGAHPINFDEQDPVKELQKLTDKQGPTRIIDAVGIDADHPHYNLFAHFLHYKSVREFKKEVNTIAPRQRPHYKNWIPGSGPSQVLQWGVESCAKAGAFSIIGVYTELLKTFPIGAAMEKNLTIRIGNCNHKAYIPTLITWIQDGTFDPLRYITHKVPLADAVDAYKQFDRRAPGWLKVVLLP